jgi:MoaA/NifB/PqqE/SkfB family radical SAM enzyme
MEKQGTLKTIDEIPLNSSVCIYGAGEAAGNFAARLRKKRKGVKILCYLDTFKTGKKENLDILKPEDAKEQKVPFDWILIASVHWKAISYRLEELGLMNYAVVSPELLLKESRVFRMKLLRFLRSIGDFFMLPVWYVKSPARFNKVLNRVEFKLKRTRLFTYPTDLGINISNVCNQQCLFCAYNPRHIKNNNWLEPGLFKKMKWLRFVSRITLFAGRGESFVNPHFIEIVKVIKKMAPGIRMETFTNGIALKGEILDTVLTHFKGVHISLNAALKETYNSVIKGGDYDSVMHNLEELSRRKPKGFTVELSMVLTRQTVSDVMPMIDLAARLKFGKVIVVHYILTDVSRKSVIDIHESVKDDPQIMEPIKQMRSYALERGVELVISEASNPPVICDLPWTSAYITNDYYMEKIFIVCCSGIEMNTFVGDSIYTNFKKTWNSKRMQLIRKTVNSELHLQNNMCFMCRNTDRMKPDWKQHLHELGKERNISFDENYDTPFAFEKELIN